MAFGQLHHECPLPHKSDDWLTCGSEQSFGLRPSLQSNSWVVIEITDSQSAKDKNRHGIMPNLIDAGNMITEWKRGAGSIESG